jgi:hypothetical protein
MMNPSDHLIDHVLRARLMDLSFSLYECLGELLNDLVYLDGTDDPHDGMDDLFGRIDRTCMNCLGDIELLAPIMVSIRKGLAAPVQ